MRSTRLGGPGRKTERLGARGEVRRRGLGCINENPGAAEGGGTRGRVRATLGGRVDGGKPRAGAGVGAAVGLWPPQKSMGVLVRGLSFSELGTQHRRWRRCRQRFGPRLGPRGGSTWRGGRGRASGQAGGQGAWRAGTKGRGAGSL